MPRVLSAKAASLAELAATGTKTFTYVYDFGDDWEHKVKIEKTYEPAPGAAYPRLIEASGRCPPEDVGGPWGYVEYLEVLCNPNHERHTEMVEWRGSNFDPKVVDVPGIEKEQVNARQALVTPQIQPPAQGSLTAVVSRWLPPGHTQYS